MDQIRTCMTCGREAPREVLLRFAVAPDGRVLPDVLGRAPGRGIWTCPTAACIGGLPRAGRYKKAVAGTKAALDAPSALAAARDGIAARVTSLLTLARKAGRLSIGTDETLAAVKARRASVAAVAVDAAGKVGEIAGEVRLDLRAVGKRRLGALLGGRGECAALAVNDAGLGRTVRSELGRLDAMENPSAGSGIGS